MGWWRSSGRGCQEGSWGGPLVASRDRERGRLQGNGTMVLVRPSGGEVESCRLVPTAGGSAFVAEVVTPRGAQGHRSGSQGTGLWQLRCPWPGRVGRCGNLGVPLHKPTWVASSLAHDHTALVMLAALLLRPLPPASLPAPCS